jgi:DedD protein
MEKKKLLFVAISVGVFLIVVIGLSILIFLPKKNEPIAGSRTVAKPAPVVSTGISPESPLASEPERTQPATVDAVDMIRNREGIQTLQTPSPVTDKNNGSNLVIEVPRPSTAAVPNSAPTGRAASSPTTPVVSTGGTTTARAPTPVATVPASVKPTQQTKIYDDYWIQAGSFSTQIRAEGVKEMLASKGINAIIENRDVNGQMFFRVRVGPYTSQNEADYWLAFIKNISGFEGSQIWQTQSER